MLKNLSDLLERPAALRDKIFKRIFDVAEISSLDDEDKKKYISNMQTARDTYNQLEYAKKKGREEGLKEGIEKGLKEGLEQGRKEECFKNAKKMKQAGIAFDVIAQVTGLSIGEIASL